MTSPETLERVDHLVYAAADLDRGIAEIERLLGIRASIGGRHPLWGTRNALVSLGPRAYLEIIAPDLEQMPRSGARPFGLDGRDSSRLVGWAAKGSQLAGLREAALRHGVELGPVLSGSRTQSDGVVLSWMLTDPGWVVADGIAPFSLIGEPRRIRRCAHRPARRLLDSAASIRMPIASAKCCAYSASTCR